MEISGNSSCVGEREVVGNPGILLKGPHTDSHSQALTLGSGEGTTSQEEPQKSRERLSYAASGKDLEGQPTLSLYCAFLPCNHGQMPYFLC